ncbi:copper resistance protein CopC [Actinotalea ferrariae]|uniref:copper resistance CopC family protein n=1 Tax=Actinotalea ferrariae TaxID=1386098 RepID=UPI001C8B99CD|nr:copper resistance CopC family protein [Actinotalea ferrariae]MBX9246085.1 copper resistance protein CopC [Actinotalea ferrariae]
MTQLVDRRPAPRPLGGRRIGAVARAASRTAVRAVTALVALVALFVVAGPAAAHDQLLGSDPADGAALTAAPTQVVLTFSAEPLAIGGAAVVVTGPDGADWSDGAPVIAGTTVTQALRAGMPAGAYAVAWQAPSSDGHVLDGTFSFSLEAAPAVEPTPAPSPSEAPTEPAPEPTPTATSGPAADDDAGTAAQDEAAEGSSAVPWIVAGLVVLVAAGVVLTVVLRRRGRGA